MQIHARTALLEDGWAHDARIEIVDQRIRRIRLGTPAPGDIRADVLTPAPGNLHSHAFQRAMAGMTELRAKGRDSFWTWRELMYRFLDLLRPEHLKAIAAMAFVEMLEAGFAAVGEFHYVHHQPGGAPYADLAEMSLSIFEAAGLTGVGLTHLPVLYTYGGVDHAPLSGGQLRFGASVEQYLRLREACRTGARALPGDTRIGAAPHSLRATSPADLSALVAEVGEGPVHIHIAEQMREVEEIEAALGRRPVDWLLSNVDVDERWCLIHATHMTAAETTALAASKAVAGLCPITEANLGDGVFNGAAYLTAGGAFGVGSDSNVRISLADEMRMLEYSQRLRDRARNVLAPPDGSTGHALFIGAAKGAAQALGRDVGAIAVGRLADLAAFDRDHPSLCALTDAQLFDGFCFAAPDGVVTDLWSAGRHVVAKGRHVERDQVRADYRAAVRDLTGRL